MPTVEILARSDANYSDIPTIYKFCPEYFLVGGVNMPKLIVCVGSDGKNYRQLVVTFFVNSIEMQ